MNQATPRKMTIEEFQMGTRDGESKVNDSDLRNSTELLNEFAGYTTLHGLRFILESFSPLRRILWAILMLLGTGTLVFGCFIGFNKLMAHDSVTVKEQQRDKTILFPAVTICNENMMRKDKIMGTKAQQFLDDIESLMFNESLRNDANNTFNLDLAKVVREAGHNITDMLIGCTWQEKMCGPDDFYLFISAQVRTA